MAPNPLYSSIDIESYRSEEIDDGSQINNEKSVYEKSKQPSSPVIATSREGKTKHQTFGHTSHFWVQPHESFDGDNDDQVLRSLFLQKVYSLLSCQLLLTAAISLLFMNVDSFRVFALFHSFAMVLLGSIGGFVTLMFLMAYKDMYPFNLRLLALFTFFESLLVGVICAIYQQQGLGDIIFQAFGITTLVFLVLTLFAATSQFNFKPYLGLFSALLTSMIIWSFFCLMFGMSQGYLYSWIGVIVFSGFIVIDTQFIIDKFGYDDYIVASIELYLDFINLFLYILRLLSSSRSRD